MDQFPDTISRKFCMDVITKNQQDLIKKVRSDFCNKIIKSLETCEMDIELTFH